MYGLKKAENKLFVPSTFAIYMNIVCSHNKPDFIVFELSLS